MDFKCPEGKGDWKLITEDEPNENSPSGEEEPPESIKYPNIRVDISHLDTVDYLRQFGNMVVDALNKAGVDRHEVIDYSRLSMSLSQRSLRSYTEKLVVVVDNSGLQRH